MHSYRLETQRMILRPIDMSDAAAVQALADDWEVARNTLNIPYPYTLDDAQTFIQGLLESDSADHFPFVMTLKDDTVMGAISISRHMRHHRGEIGYWIGEPFRRKGYTTEAARRVIQFGFEELYLHRVYASYFRENIASRRVMEKAGMTYEGTLRHHY